MIYREKIAARRLRQAKGWTLQEAARQTGFAYQTIGNFERGIFSGSKELIEKYASALGVTREQLLEPIDIADHEILREEPACQEMAFLDFSAFDLEWLEETLKDQMEKLFGGDTHRLQIAGNIKVIAAEIERRESGKGTKTVVEPGPPG
jgi:transcriptional regulator with XRE-family HTH domain